MHQLAWRVNKAEASLSQAASRISSLEEDVAVLKANSFRFQKADENSLFQYNLPVPMPSPEWMPALQQGRLEVTTEGAVLWVPDP